MKVSSQSGSSLLRRSRVGLLTKSICAALAISAMSLQASAEDAAPKAPVKPLEAAKTTEATPDAKGIVWVEDFEAAKALAAKEKKDLLIDFTGSDWCGWCIKLRKEVFDKPAFAVAAKDYIFVELDYPQQKKLDPKIKEQNTKLQTLFAVQGFPTIILADAQGRPFAQTGYQPGGPDAYLKHLDELKAAKTKRDLAFSKAESATGVEKAKLLSVGLKALNEELVSVHYKSVVEEIKKLDPKDETGVTANFGFKADLADLYGKYTAGDPKVVAADVRAALDKFLADHPKATTAQKQDAMISMLSYYRPPKDNEAVGTLMTEVQKLDPDSDAGKMAANVLKQLETMKKKAE